MAARGRVFRKAALAVTVMAVVLASLPACLSAGVQYTVTDLGVGSASYMDINNSGQIVGQVFRGRILPNHDPAFDVFLYSGGVVTYLSASDSYTAMSLNDAGQVVGYYVTGGRTKAFLYDGGHMNDLGEGQAFGINDLGQIVGTQGLYSGGSWTSQSLWPRAINNAGQMVGSFWGGAEGYEHGGLYSAGVLTDLGVDVHPWDINEAGEVVGTNDNMHAFLYSGGVMKDLGTMGGDYSYANGINNKGQVVGDAAAASGFIYSGGVMTNLNDLIDPASGWRVTSARGINDSGWIAAVAVNSSDQFNQEVYVLLTPVPEPATLSLLAVGLSTLGWRRKRRS